jgi:hypothetical protein
MMDGRSGSSRQKTRSLLSTSENPVADMYLISKIRQIRQRISSTFIELEMYTEYTSTEYTVKSTYVLRNM